MAHLHSTMARIRAGCRKVHSAQSGGFTACCPNHDDASPSLSFRQDHDRIVIHCHAGCKTEDVLARLGLDWPDLFADGAGPAASRNPRPRIIGPEREEPTPDWESMFRWAQDLPERSAKVAELARSLGVTVESLLALGCVWLPRVDRLSRWIDFPVIQWAECWAFPERDHEGRVIGFNRRHADGSKRSMPGSQRGLTYAGDWMSGQGPVLLVEGASDTASGLAAGLRVIGRPSNTGGVKWLGMLAELPPDVPIVVLGENDQKPDGMWPGRDGAIQTAQRLAGILSGRPVYWSLPPVGAKDLRSWLAGRTGPDAGRAFLDALEMREVQRQEAEAAIDTPHIDLSRFIAVPAFAPTAAQRKRFDLQGAAEMIRIHRADRHQFPCPHAEDHNLYGSARQGAPPQVLTIKKRCECRHGTCCDGCRAYLLRRESISARVHFEHAALLFIAFLDDTTAWSRLYARMEAYDRKHPRADGEVARGYLRVHDDGEGWLVVTDYPLSGLQRTDVDGALEMFGARLAAFGWQGGRGRPLVTSHSWSLPGLDEETERFKYLGRSAEGLTLHQYEQIAGHFGASVEELDTARWSQPSSAFSAWLAFRPGGWTEEEAQQFADSLAAGQYVSADDLAQRESSQERYKRCDDSDTIGLEDST